MTIRRESLPSVRIASHRDVAVARYWPLLVLALLVPIWSIGLFDRGIWTPDEPREYDIAHNMLRSGDLVTPQLAGEPFLEKPPLAYWVQSASMRVMGPSISAARLPNLLWAVLTALCVGMLAGDLAGERNREQAALIAAISCGTMSLLLSVQIWLATDAPLMATTAVALLCAWRLTHTTGRQELGWSLLLGVALAGSALAKNGAGLLVPGLTVLAWLAWERRLPQLLRWPWWVAAACVALLAGGWMSALARQPGGSEMLHSVLWDNLLARFLPVQSNAGYDLGHESSHWRFLSLLPVYVLPWTFAMFGAARWAFDSLRRRAEAASAVRFCIAAVAPSCLLLLLSRTARDVYFAPALLGAPVLMALWLTSSDKFTTFEHALLRLTRRALQVLAVVAAVAATLVLVLTGIQMMSALAVLLLVAVMRSATRLSLQATPRPAYGVVGAAGMFLVALGALELFVFPTIDRSQDLRRVVVAAAPQLERDHIAIYCGDETIRATLDYAIELRLPNVCTTEDAERLLSAHSDQQFLVMVPAAPAEQRMKELFPDVDWSRWMSKGKSPRPEREAVPAELGLHQTASWSAPGGRRYALYGRAASNNGHALPVE